VTDYGTLGAWEFTWKAEEPKQQKMCWT